MGKEYLHQVEIAFIQIEAGAAVGSPETDGTKTAVFLVQALLQIGAVASRQDPAFAVLMVAWEATGFFDRDNEVAFARIANAAPKDAPGLDDRSRG
jgi:hypothetical protein